MTTTEHTLLTSMRPLIGRGLRKLGLFPPPAQARHSGPLLSLVVIVYKMPEQAVNTLYTLSPQFQQAVESENYEVIVVENASSDELGEARACQFASNVRYFHREESQPTPVHAINFGAAQARGQYIALMIDGARMVTPGVVSNLLLASQVQEGMVVSVPGYHLGEKLQQEAMHSGYDQTTEKALLEQSNWKADGYALFDICCLSGSCKAGYLRPMGESNCLCMSTQLWDELGGVDTGFTLTGGGKSNLDLYKRALERPDTTLVIIPGEGTFHQFHGGVTTGQEKAIRDPIMISHAEEYKQLRGDYHIPPEVEPLLFGKVSHKAMRFLQHSSNAAINLYGTKFEPRLPRL